MDRTSVSDSKKMEMVDEKTKPPPPVFGLPKHRKQVKRTQLRDFEVTNQGSHLMRYVGRCDVGYQIITFAVDVGMECTCAMYVPSLKLRLLDKHIDGKSIIRIKELGIILDYDWGDALDPNTVSYIDSQIGWS